MTRKERIRSAYRRCGDNASFYDGMMTYSTRAGKAICRMVWNMDREKNLRYIELAPTVVHVVPVVGAAVPTVAKVVPQVGEDGTNGSVWGTD